MATTTFSKFTGMNNVARPESARKGDLQTALNVDFDDERNIRLRRGRERVYAGTILQVIPAGRDLLFREGAALKRLEPDNTATTLRTGFTGTRPVASPWLNGMLYWSDGELSGVYQERVDRSWGLAPPDAPVLAATIGDLVPGAYQIATTYLRNDGQESGASTAVFITTTATAGGISVTAAPSVDVTVDGIAVYASTVDGEVLWRQGVLPNAAATFRLGGNLLGEGTVLATQHLSPPPEGELLEWHRGRIYIVNGPFYWYTEDQWQYELVNLAHNHGALAGEITMFSSAEGGIWAATEDEVVFLAGEDPERDGGLRVRTRIEAGAIKGTARKVDSDELEFAQLTPGKCVVWASEDGIYVGDSAGQFKNLTGDYFTPPLVADGSAYTCSFDGVDQYLFSLRQNAAGSGSARVVVRS